MRKITKLYYEIPSNTQNIIDNMNEDIFMPFDAEGNSLDVSKLSNVRYIGFDGENYHYIGDEEKEKDGKKTKEKKKFFSKEKAKNWWTGLFGTKEERIARRAERRANRAERKRLRLQKKSIKQIERENAAKERALALGKSPAEAEAAAKAAGAQQKAAEESQITAAEEKARAEALKNGLTPQQAEEAANAAGTIVEQQIFGGGNAEQKKDVSFWKSMGTGGKIALVGGGVVVVGLLIWAIVKSSKK